VSSEIRILSIAAGAAFLVSAVTGLASRVSFGALLLRAVLSGAAFAALGAGAAYIARIFLPELFGETSGPDSAAPVPGPAEAEHHLNIVLPGGEEAVEEVEELPDALDPAGAGEDDLRNLEREAAEIGADSLVPEEESREARSPVSARPPASFDDLDVLPDLDGLSDVFSAASHEDIDAGEAPARDPISTTGASRDGIDAATMAQAVRTLLKRDQKG
jgi:hypothetical protein